MLLDACRKYGIKRYHQVSTDEVYGDLPLDRPDLFFTETTNLHTSSLYSASKASADKKLPVYGDGLNVRDWLYVEDHCAAINLILEKGKVGEVYNIVGHNERANIDVVKTILKQLGKTEDLIEYVGDCKGHDRRYAIDPTKIHNELGWLPETKFEDGIKATVQWYLDNRQWWKGIINRMN